LNEAWEEAGLRGHIVGEPLGTYEDAKWGAVLQVTALMMKVTECEGRWLEADVRERRWVNPEQASELLSKSILRRFIDTAVRRILEAEG
jgi:8-oxo-dGTP pyrophosphatase MutT (NUDIX family)